LNTEKPPGLRRKCLFSDRRRTRFGLTLGQSLVWSREEETRATSGGKKEGAFSHPDGNSWVVGQYEVTTRYLGQRAEKDPKNTAQSGSPGTTLKRSKERKLKGGETRSCRGSQVLILVRWEDT